MTKPGILATLIFAFALVGCQTSATNCAGWRKPPKINDPARLVRVEKPLSVWVVSTDSFGREQGCWE